MDMENLQLFISIVEGTNDLIHSIDRKGRFEFVNRAWLEKLGYDAKDIQQLELSNILFPGYLRKHEDLVSKVFKGQQFTDLDVVFLTKNGDMIHTEGNLFPRKEGVKVVGATGFFRDVTDRKEAEKQLQEERVRTEFFVDLMVHDIANINQEVMSLMELIIFHKNLAPELKTLVIEGLTEVERASDLISNVKKIISVSSKEIDIKLYDLFEAVETAKKEVESNVPEKQLELEINFEASKYQVLADEFLKDVFFSLFHNSMKFSPGKTVKIEVEAEALAHTPFLKVQIRDYGNGIPDLQKERIFSRLSHRRESAEGLGLGLTLVNKILGNYGSIIRVEDRVEGDYTKGTNFVILFRYETGKSVEEDGN